MREEGSKEQAPTKEEKKISGGPRGESERGSQLEWDFFRK